jgi:hypothetical protein
MRRTPLACVVAAAALALAAAPLPPPHLLCPYTAAAWDFARHIQPQCGREVYDALHANCSSAAPYTDPVSHSADSSSSVLGGGAVVVDSIAGSDFHGDGTAARPFATLSHGVQVACSAQRKEEGKVQCPRTAQRVAHTWS